MIKLESGLWIVATPIGNLQDISQRALEVLANVDLIAAEDTRTTSVLLSTYEIKTKLVSYHEHNERTRSRQLVRLLQSGQSIALVSDAGTPLISDPGYRLLQLAIENEIDCHPIPGPSAVMTALCISGLRTDPFQFIGFLPAKNSARERVLGAIDSYPGTTVCFESRHRILASLQSIRQACGSNRDIVVCRELTKKFETVMRGTASQLRDQIECDSNQQKGEFVILISPADTREKGTGVSSSTKKLFQELCRHLPASKAASIAAKVSGESRQAVYASVRTQPDPNDI